MNHPKPINNFELRQRILQSTEYILHIAQKCLDRNTNELLNYLYDRSNLEALAPMFRYHAGTITHFSGIQAKAYWCWIDAAFFYLEATNKQNMILKHRQQRLSFAIEELNQFDSFVMGGNYAFSSV